MRPPIVLSLWISFVFSSWWSTQIIVNGASLLDLLYAFGRFLHSFAAFYARAQVMKATLPITRCLVGGSDADMEEATALALNQLLELVQVTGNAQASPVAAKYVL